jgi:hypothetical protein
VRWLLPACQLRAPGNDSHIAPEPMRRHILIISITLVLLLFCSMPIVIVLVGGVSQALGGLAIIGSLALLQVPLLLLLKRFVPMPVDTSDDEGK